MVNEKGYTHRLSISKSTKEKVLVECVDEFLQHHPELEGSNITANQIVLKIAKYYTINTNHYFVLHSL